MAFNVIIKKEQLGDLWRLREYAAKGPIARQIRQAIAEYLKIQEEQIGCPLKDVEEVIRKHEEEKKHEKN